tara:strand:+ start:214 stop:558 length:345 start_codon:yes stop_codon:yes gene_type:complete
MKASELRVGNYFLTKNKSIKQVKEIHENTIVWYSEHMKHHINFIDIEPIQLTEQWLLDFGVKKLERGYAFGFKTPELVVKNLWMEFNLDIKYVHQLQNLFFALTGEELTIKEKV